MSCSIRPPLGSAVPSLLLLLLHKNAALAFSQPIGGLYSSSSRGSDLLLATAVNWPSVIAATVVISYSVGLQLFIAATVVVSCSVGLPLLLLRLLLVAVLAFS